MLKKNIVVGGKQNPDGVYGVPIANTNIQTGKQRTAKDSKVDDKVEHSQKRKHMVQVMQI